ncbi:hypothetical protein GCM10009001_29290 [Virgibacillus siamensis]|uniref:ChsH2 C-terminal OB-fold domain-containing protein n=1 Tax=Virgibacillus siamensis TaxID=480071 RepID=A0ABN1GFB5_9BACI
MEAFKCKNCGYETITSSFYCPKCHTSEFDKIDITESGKVYSFTTIYVAPPEFAHFVPYQVVLVQLTDKIRLTTFMKELVEIGDKVSFKEIQNGAYVFEKSK